jgi:hypothetical protein
LDEDARKIVDYLRRVRAESLIGDGVTFEEALEGIISLHEAGYMTVVACDDRMSLVPCFIDGKVVDGFLGGAS